MKLKLQILLIAAIAMIGTATFAKTTTYNGSTWNNGVPAGSTDVVIITGGTFSLPANITYASLTLNGGSFNTNGRTFTVTDVTLTSGTFTTAANQTFSGTLTMNGGSYTLGTTSRILTVGNLTVQSGTLTLPCNLTVNSTLTLNGGSFDVNARTFSATNLFLTSGTFTAAASTTFSGTVTMNGGSYTLGSTSSTLTAANVLVQSGTISLPSNLTVNTTLTLNGGSMNVNSRTLTVTNIALTSGTLSLGGTVVNPSGNLTLNGGTLSLGGADITLGGDITVTANSIISSTGTSTLDATGSLLTINGGTLLLDNVEVVIDNLTFSSNHDINASNGGFLSFDNSTQHQINGSNPGFATNSAHVNAKVRLYTKSGNNGIFYFPIGDGTTYSPFIFTPTSVTGSGAFTQWVEATYVGAISPNKNMDLTTLNSASGYEYWVVNTSSSSVIGTVALRYDNNSTKTGKTVVNSTTNINSDLIVAQYLTANSKWTGISSTKATASNLTVATTSSSISPNTSFTLASNNARTSFIVPLPVTLLNFTAIANTNSKSVELKWETTFEENSNQFEVMKSEDGLNWFSIGTVYARGNSNQLSSYNFTDNQPYAINHYKLREVANNGDFTYSDVKVARFSDVASNKVTIYPNPAKDILNVNCSNIDLSNPVRIQLTNLMGQVVFESTVEASFSTSLNTAINIAGLSAGSYQISIAGSNLVINERLIIAH